MWRLTLPTPPRLIMLSCSSLAEPLTAARGGGGALRAWRGETLAAAGGTGSFSLRIAEDCWWCCCVALQAAAQPTFHPAAPAANPAPVPGAFTPSGIHPQPALLLATSNTVQQQQQQQHFHHASPDLLRISATSCAIIFYTEMPTSLSAVLGFMMAGCCWACTPPCCGCKSAVCCVLLSLLLWWTGPLQCRALDLWGKWQLQADPWEAQGSKQLQRL
jgi:hypothetical protein